MFKWLARKTAQSLTHLPQVNPRERIYAIGDIHGCHDLIEVLFEKIVRDAEAMRDDRIFRVVFLGDYIDRGDRSREVLEHLRMIEKSLPSQTEFLMGNHEAALLDFLETDARGSSWVEMGGRQTLGSFGIRPPKSSDDVVGLKLARRELRKEIRPHMPFLKSLKKIVRSGDVVFTHAGLDPERPLNDQPDSALLWGKPGFRDHKGKLGLRVVHGHFGRGSSGYHAKQIGVDTGAYYSGRLTAIRLDYDEQLIDVDRANLPDKKPNSVGRGKKS